MKKAGLDGRRGDWLIDPAVVVRVLLEEEEEPVGRRVPGPARLATW